MFEAPLKIYVIFRGKPMTEKLKIVLGLLLLACTFLPLGSCERLEPTVPDSAIPKSPSMDSKSPVMDRDTVEYLVPIKMLHYNEPMSWLFVIAFVWPLPFLLIKRRFLKTKWKRRIGDVLELLFACGASFFIYSMVFTLWYEPMLWGYIATLAIFLYVFVHLVEMFGPYIKLRIRRI
jgi:hypothetical protein